MLRITDFNEVVSLGYEDPNERAGERIVKYKWDDWHYAGLDISQLTDEQKSAFDQLGNILRSASFCCGGGCEN